MELLYELLRITNSQIKALEILDVINGTKQVARQGYRKSGAIKEFCKKNNLFVFESPIRIKLLDYNKAFSNKGIVTHSDTDDTLKLLYISFSKRLAMEASLAELKGDDVKLGRLLGYPDCCINFFVDNKRYKMRTDFNYEDIILNNTNEKNKYYFGLNIFMREKDACLLSHFPCSLDCEESRKIAERRYNLLKRHNEKFALSLKKILKGKVEKHGKIIDFNLE